MRGSSALMRHSMAWPGEHDLVLRHRQAAAGGDADLLVHEVDAGDRLGDRMLHLQAGVHLDEVELAVLVEELDRAGAAIFQLAHGVGADFADLHPLLDVERRGVGLFPDLLVAALQRAVALAEMDGVAFAVADHLDFDVARLAEDIFPCRRRRCRRRPWLRSGPSKRPRSGRLRAWRPSCRVRRRRPWP